MITYEYKARNSSGNLLSGVMECSSEQEFYRKLEEKQLFCVEMRTKTKQKENGRTAHFTTKEISLFCREFSVMLLAGMNMLSALQLLYNRARKTGRKNCYMRLIEGIEKGDSLYDAMRKQKKVFPNMLISMVMAGEASGKIDIVMDKMAVYYEKEADLKNKMVNAMIYPLILIFITLAVIILLFTFVLPRFFTLFSGQDIPAITRFFMNVSYVMTNYWYVLVLAVLVLAVAFHGLLRSEKVHEKADAWMLKIPILGSLLEKIIIARFANAMNILYSSGITIVQSISISIGTVSNLYIAGKLTMVNELIEKGVALSEAMQREELFDNMIWSMVQIGEESGSLETMFSKLSEYYSKESESATQKMMAVMEPLVLVVIATVIALVIASVLLPIYSMYQ